MLDTVIRGGTLVTPSDTFEADVGIKGEQIAALGSAVSMPDAEFVVDASGKLVLPGIIDPHVHIDDMFSFDTYESAGRAAALGGTTTFIDFGWQPWIGDLSIWDYEGTPLDGVEYKQ
ncbi:MAG: allantoinase, partial [Halobacteriales archaeon]